MFIVTVNVIVCVGVCSPTFFPSFIFPHLTTNTQILAYYVKCTVGSTRTAEKTNIMRYRPNRSQHRRQSLNPDGGNNRAGMRPPSREVSPEKRLSAGDERLDLRSASLNHTTDVHQDVSLNRGSVLRTEPQSLPPLGLMLPQVLVLVVSSFLLNRDPLEYPSAPSEIPLPKNFRSRNVAEGERGSMYRTQYLRVEQQSGRG